MRARPRLRTLVFRAGCALVLATVFADANRGVAAADRREETRRLLVETEILRHRYELARGDHFYLVLDRGEGTLRMMLKGALLHEYRIRAIEIGVPRVAFVPRSASEDWDGRVWDGGTLDPPRELDRLVIEAPPVDASRENGEPEPPPLPPTPDEAYPVPGRFLIRFDDGLALEIRGDEGAGDGPETWIAGVLGWFSDRFAVLRPTPKDIVRLRLELARDDAESLYRALPPDIRLLIVPPPD